MISTLFIAVSLFLLIYAFYWHFSSIRSTDDEIRRMERVELHLAHILRLLDAPDVRMMLREPESRYALFLDFSKCLREDVGDLIRLRKLRFGSLVFIGLFFACYYLMRAKARFACGRNDLRFLSAVELGLFRTLER